MNPWINLRRLKPLDDFLDFVIDQEPLVDIGPDRDHSAAVYTLDHPGLLLRLPNHEVRYRYRAGSCVQTDMVQFFYGAMFLRKPCPNLYLIITVIRTIGSDLVTHGRHLDHVPNRADISAVLGCLRTVNDNLPIYTRQWP